MGRVLVSSQPTRRMGKTELIIELNRLPETRALWNRDAVLRYAKDGEEALVTGKLRQAPESMKRLFKVIVNKLFALDRFGTDFSYQPERVEADGFRPYFVDDLMRWTGIPCRDTVTKGLRWLARRGLITLRKPIRDGVTGQFSYAMLRFNPGVMITIAETVVAILVKLKNAWKTGRYSLSPCRTESGSTVVSSPAAAVPLLDEQPSGLEKGDSTPAGDAALNCKDQKLEEVLSVLQDTYPDVLTLSAVDRKLIRKLVHSIFPRYRLTVEAARELVKCKQYDDEWVNPDNANTQGTLEGFNRFEKFTELLPFWKSHIAKLIRSSRMSGYDQKVELAASYHSSLRETVTTPTIVGLSAPTVELETFKQLVTAIKTESPADVIKAIAQKAAGYLRNDETSYAILVKLVPAIRTWCGIDRYDHERLLRDFKKQDTKIKVWMNIRAYAGIS